jgi:hypothetical protein
MTVEMLYVDQIIYRFQSIDVKPVGRETRGFPLQLYSLRIAVDYRGRYRPAGQVLLSDLSYTRP